MPSGTMRWFDTGTGEGRVVASGREYPVFEDEVEPHARATGSRVRFDVARIDGVRTAVRVRAVSGTRSSRRQRRFGDLTGAGRPEEKGRAPSTHQRDAVDPLVPGRPAELVRRWIAAANSGHVGAVSSLYAPHAVLHTADGDRHGRGDVARFLIDSGLLSRGWDARPSGSGGFITALRRATAPDAGRSTRFRIMHGQIVEQWVDEPGR